MSRSIVYWPDPVLLEPASPVTSIDEEVFALLADMRRVLFDLRGVGLAAPQVGVSLQVMLVCPGGEPGTERVLINPRILARQGEESAEEGCLSLPGLYGNVVRSVKIRVRHQDLSLREHEEDLSGFPARVFQHEWDHLQGRLFIDRLRPADRAALEEDLQEARRRFETAGR